MNFVLAAGGTGGHMVPAHALASELRKRGHGVLLITDDRGARFPGLFQDVPVHILPAGRLGGGPVAWLKALSSVVKGRGQAKRLYREHRPDGDEHGNPRPPRDFHRARSFPRGPLPDRSVGSLPTRCERAGNFGGVRQASTGEPGTASPLGSPPVPVVNSERR